MSKLLIGALTMTFVLGGTVSVFAAPSPEVTVIVDDKPEQYEVSNIKDGAHWKDVQEKNKETAAAIEAVNKSTKKSPATFIADIEKDTNEKTKKSVEKIKETVLKSEFLTGFFDVHVKGWEKEDEESIKQNADLKRDKDGNYLVKLRVPTLTENNKNPYVLHFSKTRQEWEILTPDASGVDYKEKTITVSFKDFSPAAIMAVIDSEEAPAPTAVTENTEEENPEVIADDNTEDTKDTEDSSSSKDSKSSSSSKSSAKSPKTGVADTWMLWFAASAVLAGAAAKKH